MTGRPLVLSLAWRREDLSATGLVSALDLERIPDVVRVSLNRLDRPSIAAIVRMTRPGRSTRRSSISSSRSRRAFLYLVEALSASDPSEVRVGGDVDALMRERIGSVGQMAAQVLSSASVIGRSFDLATVRHTSGRSDEETVEAPRS